MNPDTNSLEEAIQRSKLSSSNQMEMLTFRLTDHQLYGINVFKIIEIIECPKRLDAIPYAHPAMKGIVDFRGQGITVIDVSQAINMDPVDFKNELGYLVVCEYNNQLNAFLVKEPESLLTRGWDEIQKPKGFHAKSLVAVTYSIDEEMILLLDIEMILDDVIGMDTDLCEQIQQDVVDQCKGKQVLLVDDSNAAMALLKQTMENLDIQYTEYNSAVDALVYLENLVQADRISELDLIISDIEMPGMDGFTFTRNIKNIKPLAHIPIVLHSSMSNPTNQLKAKEAGANDFIAKFDPNALSEMILRMVGE